MALGSQAQILGRFRQREPQNRHEDERHPAADEKQTPPAAVSEQKGAMRPGRPEPIVVPEKTIVTDVARSRSGANMTRTTAANRPIPLAVDQLRDVDR